MRAALLILIIFLAIPTTVDASTLAAVDSGYDIAPGTKIGITLVMPYSSYFVFKWGEASVSVSGLQASIKGVKGWGLDAVFSVKVNGRIVHTEKVDIPRFQSGEISRMLILDVGCSGVVSVIVSNKIVGMFTIDEPTDIILDEVDGGKVIVNLMGKKKCGQDQGGANDETDDVNLPPPSSGGITVDMFSNAVGKALIVLTIGGVLLILLIAASQARRRGYL